MDLELQDLNRYSDIFPYNNTQVVLSGDTPIATYINADFIDSILEKGDRKIIAAQGPLKSSVEHFWRMIVEQNVKLIVTVCKLVEKRQSKCEKYWPDTDTSKDPYFKGINLNGMKVTMVKEKELGETLIERHFKISLKGQEHSVRQIHYIGWPDHGVPTGASMEDFHSTLNEFIHMLLNSAKEERAVVHCSAGIGRTGTTIALANLIISASSQINSGVRDP